MQNVVQDAQPDALQQRTRSHACFSVKSAVPSAYVCLQAHMETNNIAHATTTGRPREEAPNALRLLVPNCFHCPTIYVYLSCSAIKVLMLLNIQLADNLPQQ
ncbi:hypothetical protein CRYUN_Cryun02cG0143400 [Craigia yunnanensis]